MQTSNGCWSENKHRLLSAAPAAIDRCASIFNDHAADPVRLVSQSGQSFHNGAGRLEIFINNQWGTVCDDFFDLSDGVVACEQLGFPGSVVAIGRAAALG